MSHIIAGDPAPTKPSARDELLMLDGSDAWPAQVDGILTRHRAEVLNDVADELARVDFHQRAKGNYRVLASGFVRRFRRRAEEVVGTWGGLHQDDCAYVRGTSRDCTCGGESRG